MHYTYGKITKNKFGITFYLLFERQREKEMSVCSLFTPQMSAKPGLDQAKADPGNLVQVFHMDGRHSGVNAGLAL